MHSMISSKCSDINEWKFKIKKNIEMKVLSDIKLLFSNTADYQVNKSY